MTRLFMFLSQLKVLSTILAKLVIASLPSQISPNELKMTTELAETLDLT